MPSKITSLSTRNLGFTRATNAVKGGGSAFFQAYAQKPADLDNEIDLSQSVGFQADQATPTNVTVTQKSVTLPQDNYGGRYTYRPGETEPLLFRPSPILEFTSSAINGTAVFAQAPRDYSDSNYLYVVYRNTGSALSAGDLNLVLRSSVGNYVTITSQKTGSQNEWVYEIFKLQEDGTTGVAFTGTPVFTSMETDVVVTQSGDTLEVAKIYTAQTQLVFPPIANSVDLGSTCLEELAKELGHETFDLTCALDLKDKITNGFNPSWTFQVKQPSIYMDALAYGSTPKSVQLDIVEELNIAVNSNVLSLGSAVGSGNAYTDVKKVYVNGEIFTPSLVSAGADLERTEYYLDTSTGDITLSTGAFTNGTVFTVEVGAKKTTDGRVVKGNDLGTVGKLILTLKENGQAKVFNYKAKLMPDSTDFSNDNSITDTYMVSVLDDNNTKETYGIY